LQTKKKKKQEHLEKINVGTGRNFSLNVAWSDMTKEFMKDRPENFATSLWDSCLGGLADNIKKLCEDETGKNAFNEFATTGVILFNVNKKAPSYWSETFTNGDLVIGFKSICNVYEIGRAIPGLLTCTFEENVMPYLQVKSINDKQEKFNELLQSLHEITGRQIPIVYEWAKLLPFIKDVAKIQPSNVGGTLYDSVVEGLVGNLKKLCSDEMGKEGFNESCTGSIIFTVETDKKASGYWTEKFVNGDLVIAFKSICNVSEIGRQVEKLL